WLHEVIDEWIVGPFGNLVTEGVDVLQRPVGLARGSLEAGVGSRAHPRGPCECLHGGVAVRTAVAAAVTGRAGSVIPDHTTPTSLDQQHVVAEVDGEVRRVGGLLQIVDLP